MNGGSSIARFNQSRLDREHDCPPANLRKGMRSVPSIRQKLSPTADNETHRSNLIHLDYGTAFPDNSPHDSPNQTDKM